MGHGRSHGRRAKADPDAPPKPPFEWRTFWWTGVIVSIVELYRHTGYHH